MGIKLERVDKRYYKLLDNHVESIDNISVLVRSGFLTDGASIPKIFWSIIGSPFTGEYTEAAVVHDALYASESLTRIECDKMFYELMKKHGVSYWKRTLMYIAVRIGGGSVWAKHTTQGVADAKTYIIIDY